MEILENIILFLAILLTIVWISNIRQSAKLSEKRSHSKITATFLFIISFFITLIFHLSTFNFLWMFPVSIMIGLMSHKFPFIIISFPAIYLERLIYIGIDHNKMTQLKFDRQDALELMKIENIPEEEALSRVKARREKEQKEIDKDKTEMR